MLMLLELLQIAIRTGQASAGSGVSASITRTLACSCLSAFVQPRFEALGPALRHHPLLAPGPSSSHPWQTLPLLLIDI